MNIVIDSNILFSALIKDSMIRKIILFSQEKFTSSEIIITEYLKYKGELILKSKLTENEFQELFSIIMKNISLIGNEELKYYIQEAKEICKNIDPKDTEFIACALAYSDSILWTEDKALKKIQEIRVCNTQEILEILF